MTNYKTQFYGEQIELMFNVELWFFDPMVNYTKHRKFDSIDAAVAYARYHKHFTNYRIQVFGDNNKVIMSSTPIITN